MSQQRSFNFRSEHVQSHSGGHSGNHNSTTHSNGKKQMTLPSTTSSSSSSSTTTTTTMTRRHVVHSHDHPSSSSRKKLSHSDQVQEYLLSIASSYPIIDIGINLTNHQFKDHQETISQVLKRCQLVNVKCVILTGTSLRNSMESLSLVSKYQSGSTNSNGSGGSNSTNSNGGVNSSSNNTNFVQFLCTVGIHPHDAKSFKNISELEQVITTHPQKESICMIGECGLDYNRMFSPKDVQIHCFKEQLRMATRLQKPIFCHERDAHHDFVECIQSVMKESHRTLPPLVVHCFTGTRNEAKKYIDMGFYIGLTGCVCMDERGKELRDILKEGIIPRDKLLIETDSPFMLPPLSGNNGQNVWKFVVNGGRRNEPCLLPHVVNTIAKCWNMEENKQELEKQLTENTARFLMMDVKELVGV
ncbi:hypothetical protein FDP41_010025 [Naegleria fowleri]|uniref:TatD related DNase n=1 Tax=Naegleria fowleri TaxID=5763 RepID=A0A6A5B9E5_NAEFO|nr:uncharacterized protein FDP41_010025 [Naegleria fowleri]KAF0971802.1 hypothetical protein FDP41_010025 [Naegleria fowleri]